MRGIVRFFVSVCLLLPALGGCPVVEASADPPWEKRRGIVFSRPAEHQELEEYEGPATCAACHDGVIDEVMQSNHYTWAPKLHGGGKYSKLQMSAVPINWLWGQNGNRPADGCGMCHIGGGPMPVDPALATEADREGIDCLICHAATYDMKVRLPVKRNGTWVLPQDRSLEAARSAGRTTQEACLRCHQVPLCGSKRGADLREDVHYQAGMSCTRCHRVEAHRFPGFGPTISREVARKVRCVDCHDTTPHRNEALNRHQRLDCRTCHVVEAGGVHYKNGARNGMYDELSGTYKFEVRTAREKPFYFWYDGFSKGPIPKGSIHDSNSRIQPFKKFRGVAPVDAETGEFLWLKLGLFSGTGRITEAIRAGVEESGRPYSSQWKPKEYEVYFQLSHGVTRERALRCENCHSQRGSFDFKALGYPEEEAGKLSVLLSRLFAHRVTQAGDEDENRP